MFDGFIITEATKANNQYSQFDLMLKQHTASDLLIKRRNAPTLLIVCALHVADNEAIKQNNSSLRRTKK